MKYISPQELDEELTGRYERNPLDIATVPDAYRTERDFLEELYEQRLPIKVIQRP